MLVNNWNWKSGQTKVCWPSAIDWMYRNVEQFQWNNDTVHQQQKLKKSLTSLSKIKGGLTIILKWVLSDHRSLHLFWSEYCLTTGPYPYSEVSTVWPYVLTLILKWVLSDHRSLPLFWGEYCLTTCPYPYSEGSIVWPQVLTLILRYCLTTGPYPYSEGSIVWPQVLTLILRGVSSDYRSLPLFWGGYCLTTGPYSYSEGSIVWPQVLTLILRGVLLSLIHIWRCRRWP